jgi:hypothetical protein
MGVLQGGWLSGAAGEMPPQKTGVSGGKAFGSRRSVDKEVGTIPTNNRPAEVAMGGMNS